MKVVQLGDSAVICFEGRQKYDYVWIDELDPDAPTFQSESFNGIRDTSLALRNVNANRNRLILR
jgi:hypothetical protein